MTPLDWMILAFALVAGLWGYARGLVAGALILVGFAGGAFVGSRLGPLLLNQGAESPYAPLLALTGALLLGALASSLLELVGIRLQRGLAGWLGVLDGVGGALLVAALALGMAWIVGAVALHAPAAGELRESVQRSKILRELNAALPPSGSVLQALARLDPFPRIDGPAPDVGPPDAAIARDPEVAAAAKSVVRVLGTACGLGVQGSGWIARDGVVVTNAHVIAGQLDTTVQLRGEGDRLDAEAIWLDPGNDLALLRVSELADAPPLRLAGSAPSGTSAAVLGFPENGSYDVRAARIGGTRTAISQDAYGRGPIQRSITSVRGLVRSGNSGGPVVDGDGEVLATIFAAATSSRRPAGFAIPGAVMEAALEKASGAVGTGPCVG